MPSYKAIQAAEDGIAGALEPVVMLGDMEDLVRTWYVSGKMGPEMYKRLLGDIYATRLQFAQLRDDYARLRGGNG